MWLLNNVIDSFHTGNDMGIGLPLGNVTSQVFINIYMNELDQFIKRDLKVKYFIRYADDFVILDSNKDKLYQYTSILVVFLKNNLKLELHPDKVFIKTLDSGVDFLGWINFHHHRVLRTSTKRRMFRRLKYNNSKESLASYMGLLKNGNTYKLVQKIL